MSTFCLSELPVRCTMREAPATDAEKAAFKRAIDTAWKVIVRNHRQAEEREQRKAQGSTDGGTSSNG